VVQGYAPIKTAEGQAELATRQRRISQRHRTMLFLVDGRRSELQVKSLAVQAGVPESCYGELLDMGLIKLSTVAPGPTSPGALVEPSSFHLDLPLVEAEESVLPASRTLQHESSLGGELGAAESWYRAETLGDQGAISQPLDAPLEEARDLLLRAVRAEAPVAGSLTLMRLRRARTRADLLGLLDEVESRIRKPHRMLATAQTMGRVRQLLAMPASAPVSTT
jgi:hypothetical protein